MFSLNKKYILKSLITNSNNKLQIVFVTKLLKFYQFLLKTGIDIHLIIPVNLVLFQNISVASFYINVEKAYKSCNSNKKYIKYIKFQMSLNTFL